MEIDLPMDTTALNVYTDINSIIIDEPEFRSINQRKYLTEMMEIYTKLMSENIRETLEENCYGCKIEHPSPNQHTCIFINPESQVKFIFMKLFEKVDENFANEHCSNLSFLSKEVKEVFITKNELLNNKPWMDKLLQNVINLWLAL